MIYVFDCEVNQIDGGIKYNVGNIIKINQIEDMEKYSENNNISNIETSSIISEILEKGYDINVINTRDFNNGSNLLCKAYIDIQYKNSGKTDKYKEIYNILMPYIRHDIINKLIK